MNSTLSISIGEKILMIRKSERLTRKQFFELTGIPVNTQRYYETGRQDGIGSEILLKITKNLRFKKYALWLTTDETFEAGGQIAPALSLDGPSQSEGDLASIDVTQKSSRSGRNAG
ncbi:transcriptional regulator [Escherichia coli]|uniref:helix-turn-helix domain-containing protein n=1 Tax=Escherichia coli TaxID=562 RepID=UPI0017E44975|nr:helix-turn-helix domain-containing protein [Escherichia coli]EEZ1999925.1 helix-turn-helix transcriptional regulator [Escherichia coli]EEZ2511873.1 helix-turn-helix transcriptional regulator [Escherichia coli]EFA6039827.1 helix-turn-helix transcriptional regulator [Escherichia coli]EFL5589192.1 helix-turn-helix transcriptional regulator [Escherichia coli]EIZ6920046.1 helix-turn-helix transcriptional regulator [Escherichia coli]